MVFSMILAAAPAAIAQSSGVFEETPVSPSMASSDVRTVNLTLEQCRELALQNNTAVLNAGLDVAAARARKQEAVAEYFPKVSVTAMAFYAFDPMLELELTDIIGDSPFAVGLSNTLNQYAQQYGFSSIYSTL